MWIWVELENASGGGVLVILALALLAVLFLTPIVGTIIAILKFKEGDTAAGVIALLIAIAAAAFIIGSYISVKIENKDYNRGSRGLSIEVTDKKNIDEHTFAFLLTVTNDTVERIIQSDIEMVVSNSRGDRLLTTNITDLDCDTGVTKDFRLTVDAAADDGSRELFYTDYPYLKIEITIKALHYNDRVEDYTFNDHRVLKKADTKALKQAYQDARSAFDAGDYAAAIDKFSKLGGYEDSMELLERAKSIIAQQDADQAEAALQARYQKAVDLYG